MATTTFLDGQTVIYASWLNDVNNAVYNGTFPNGSISLTNLNVSGSVTGAGFSTVVNANLLTPGPIGSTTPNTGNFTTLQATSLTGLSTPLSIAQGGTALSSVGTAGYVLSSNGSGLTYTNPTAGFTGSNQSLSTNGYQKFPGGFIIQWGYASSGAITFPIAFPNACTSVTCSTDRTSGGNNGYNYAGNVTTTGCILSFDPGPGSGRWMAMGY